MYKKVMKEMLCRVLERNGYLVVFGSLKLEPNKEVGYICFECDTFDGAYHKSCGIISSVGTVCFRLDSDYSIDCIKLY